MAYQLAFGTKAAGAWGDARNLRVYLDMQVRNESSASWPAYYLRRQSRKNIPHNPPIKIAEGSGTEVVSAAWSAAKRLEPDATKQLKVTRICDKRFMITTG
jgi:hypothetical protein